MVLIGVAKHQDATIIPRPHAERDAVALYDVLTDKERGTVALEDVQLLLGEPDAKRPSKKATRENVLEALAWLAKTTKAEDRVVFGWFGAGSLDAANHRYYLPTDADPTKVKQTALTTDDLATAFQALKTTRMLAFVDVNFKGGLKDQGDIALGQNPFAEFHLNPKDLKKPFAPYQALYLASNGTEAASDLKEHSAFATALLSGLRGQADHEKHPDGLIDRRELPQWLAKEMPKLIASAPKAVDYFILGGTHSYDTITQEPHAKARIEALCTKLEEQAKAGTLAKELATEGCAFIRKTPLAKFRQQLRTEYLNLAEGKSTVAEFVAARKKTLDALVMSQEEAEAFAVKIVQVVNHVVTNTVLEVNAERLVHEAIRSLYESLDEPLPENVAAGLKPKNPAPSLEDLLVQLAHARRLLGKREEYLPRKDLDLTLQVMLSHVDDHTTYFNPEVKERLEKDIRGNFVGVGIQLRKDEKTKWLRVTTPLRDGPAREAKIERDDLIEKVIREVDSEGNPLTPPEVIATAEMPMNDVIKKILGKAGTKVKLVIRRGDEAPRTIEITRAAIHLESVFGVQRKADDSWDYMLDAERKIGYIRVNSFADNTATDLEVALGQLRKQGMKSLILDLRFNPGGLLPSATAMADMFLKDQTIVTIRGLAGRTQTFKGQAEGTLPDFPMVCLINDSSASGSEIVSAALQDHKRALIVGERSYGKGSVQQMLPFEGGLLKVTTASFWRPNGKNINKPHTSGKDEDDWGVRPDEGWEVKLTPTERRQLLDYSIATEWLAPLDPKWKGFKDRQLEKALEYLKKSS